MEPEHIPPEPGDGEDLLNIMENFLEFNDDNVTEWNEQEQQPLSSDGFDSGEGEGESRTSPCLHSSVPFFDGNESFPSEDARRVYPDIATRGHYNYSPSYSHGNTEQHGNRASPRMSGHPHHRPPPGEHYFEGGIMPPHPGPVHTHSYGTHPQHTHTRGAGPPIGQSSQYQTSQHPSPGYGRPSGAARYGDWLGREVAATRA